MSDRNRRIHCFVDVEIGGNSAGRIVLELFSDVCPRTCCNFVKLCNGLKVEDELVCFKGKPFSALDCAVTIDCTCSSDAVRDALKNRIYPDEVSVLKHFKELLLTTANRGSEANGLQWMITTASTPELNSTHLVFGRVVSGQGVVEQIHAATKDEHSRGGTARARIGNCGELKARSLDQRKPPAIYQTLTNFYSSRETPDESQEDSCAKALALASLFKRSNRLSRVGTSTSGDRKIKGRGTVRYRGSSSRSQSESDDTPPHWRTELEKVKPLGKDVKEVPEDRWIKGDKLVYVESLSRKSATYSRAESDYEDTGVHRRRSEKYSWEYEDDSDEMSSSQRSRKKSITHSRMYESDEGSSGYRRMLEKHYTRKDESEVHEDRRYKNRSRRRSRRVEYDSSTDHSPQRFIKKSKNPYSRRADSESDHKMPRRLTKSQHSQSSDYKVDDDNHARSKKKRLRHHHARRILSRNDEGSPGRSSKACRNHSRRFKDKLKDDSSDQYYTRSDSRNSRSDDSEDTDEKHRSGHYRGSAQSPFNKKGSSRRKTLRKKERDKHHKHSKKSRDFSQEPFSESESEHSRASTLKSCDMRPGKSESHHLKAPRSKSSGKQDSRLVKMKAIKHDSESEDSRGFDIKNDYNNSSLEHFGDAVRQFKKTSGFPESIPSGYSYKSEAKSSDEEIKTVRGLRKGGRSSKAKNMKLQTIGEKVKQKFDDLPKKLNSKVSKEKTATNQVTPKKSICQGGDRVEIVIPSSDEEDMITKPPLKKKLKLGLFDFNVVHASGSTRKKNDNRSALKEDFHVTERRSQNDIKKSGESMEDFRLGSNSSKCIVSNNGSMLRPESTDGSEDMPLSRSCSGSKPGEMMRLGGKKLERIVEIPKSGTKQGSRSSSSDDDDEEIQSLLTVEDKKIQSNKIPAKPHSLGSNYSLELSRKYSQMKILRLKNKLKELEAKFHAETQLQLSVSSSRLDDHDVAIEPEIVSKIESLHQSDKMLSSSHCLNSSPKRQIHGGELSSKSRSHSRTSSRKSYNSQGKHGRWSLSPEGQRKKMCSYSSSSRSYSSGSESSRSLRTGMRHATVSSSSGKSRSRTRSSSRSRSRSRSGVKSVSREGQRTVPSHHRLVIQKEVPALASVASVALPSGNSLTVVGKNMSESPPPSRWKPGQKPWKPKNMLPATNSVAKNEKMPSALSALSAERSDNIQKSQKSSKVGRSNRIDDQGRTGDGKNRELAIRGQRRNTCSSEGSSQNSSSSRSVGKGRSYNRSDSDRSQSRSDRSKSRSDRSKSDRTRNKRSKRRNESSKSRSDRSKSRSDRSWSRNGKCKSRNERSKTRSDRSRNEGTTSRNERRKIRYGRSRSRSDSNKCDRSANKSHLSLYKNKTKASKIIGSGYSSRNDSTSSSGSQTDDTGSCRSRSTSSRSSRSKVTDSRSSTIAGTKTRSDSRSSTASRNDQSYNIDGERRRIVKKSSALNAHSSQERSQPRNVLVTSSGDSDAYNKRAAVKLDKLKGVKKEKKVDKRKKDSQVQWEPPVEPEYILVDTDNEDSKQEDVNQMSIRKKWNKKSGDVTEADHDMTTGTSEELFITNNDEKHGKCAEKERENGERSSETDAMMRTMPEVQEERSEKPKNGDLREPCKVAVASDTRMDKSGTLEKPCFKAEMDIIEINTRRQSFILEAESLIIDVKTEVHIADIKVGDQIVDVKAANQIVDVKAANQIVDVKSGYQIADVKSHKKIAGISTGNQIADITAENQIADVTAENQTADVTAENQIADVKSKKKIADINTGNQIADVTTGNQIADVTTGNQIADVTAENQIADVKVENQIADIKAANEVTDVKTMNEVVIGVNADNELMNMNSQDEAADVNDKKLVAENQLMLDVCAENQMISNADALDQIADEPSLLRLEATDNDGRESHELRRTDNVLGDGAADQFDILVAESEASEAVTAEGLTPQTVSETCSAVIMLTAEMKGDPEVGSKVAIPSALVVELTPKSQMTFRQHQSRSGPSSLPRSNLQDNRLLGKQLNFTWKSRSRLPVSGSAGGVRLNSPESPHVPALSPTSSPCKLDHHASVVGETPPALVEDSHGEQGDKRQVLSKRSIKGGSGMDGESRLKSNESLRRSPSTKSSVSSDDSSSRNSSNSSRVSISSNSTAHLERSPSARCTSERSYSNSPSRSSRSGSEGRHHWRQASDSRSRSSVSELRGRTARARSRSRTRRETRSRTRSRSLRRTRSRTRSVSRKVHHRSRSRRSVRIRRSYSKRSSRSPRGRRSRSLIRRSLRSQSGSSRSRTNSRSPRSRLGRRRTRSRSTRSRTISRRCGYSRQMSSCSESDSRSRTASRNRSCRRRRCESQDSSRDSYRKRRSSPSSRSSSSSSD